MPEVQKGPRIHSQCFSGCYRILPREWLHAVTYHRGCRKAPQGVKVLPPVRSRHHAEGSQVNLPNASQSFIALNPHLFGGPVSNTELKRDKAPALDRPDAGKKEGVRQATVRFTGYRVRPLDPDNFAGSVKDLLDGLRHAGLLHGDEFWRIRLQTDQVKVRHFKEERTQIEIEYDHLTPAKPL